MGAPGDAEKLGALILALIPAQLRASPGTPGDGLKGVCGGARKAVSVYQGTCEGAAGLLWVSGGLWVAHAPCHPLGRCVSGGKPLPSLQERC